MIEERLNHDEWLHAADVGCERFIDGILKGRAPGHGSREAENRERGEGWFWDINGACGEKCVAKWLGVPWDGSFGKLRANDVGLLEVRTAPQHNHHLILHDTDRDECLFIFVTGVGPVWRIHGFITGAKGKQRQWFHDTPCGNSTGRPAYWVKQRHLCRDIEKLKQRYHAKMRNG